MGQSKGGGYKQVPTTTPGQSQLLEMLNQFAPGALSQAQAGYAQFLPGGGGGEALKQQALERYKQQYIPATLNAFGSDNKGSSALNQALAQGASNLNTDLNAQLAGQQLTAAQGLSGLGGQAAGQSLGTQSFAYMPRQMPFWQSSLLAALGAGGQLGAAKIGSPSTNLNWGGQSTAANGGRNTFGGSY